ncbi:MAG TPA: hypothetical protein VFN18_08835 [Solirubrobacterales bacterium]|nr:hypothetical protein [Solirubrobacterales bacterium]
MNLLQDPVAEARIEDLLSGYPDGTCATGQAEERSASLDLAADATGNWMMVRLKFRHPSVSTE